MFWVEQLVAHIGIVEVVEGGHAECFFAECSQLHVTGGFVGHEECRRIFVLVRRGTHSLVIECVLYEGAQQAALHMQSLPLERGGDGGHLGESGGVGKILQVGIEIVPLQVGRDGEVPPRKEPEEMGGREITLLLPVMVVDVYLAGVVAQVFGVVVGILGIYQQAVTAEIVFPAALREEVAVPLAFAVSPHVVEDRTGYAAFGVVEIGFGVPFPGRGHAEKSAFYPQGFDVAVFAHRGGVIGCLAVGQGAAVTEFVASRCVGIFGVEETAHPVADFLFPQYRGIGQPE